MLGSTAAPIGWRWHDISLPRRTHRKSSQTGNLQLLDLSSDADRCSTVRDSSRVVQGQGVTFKKWLVQAPPPGSRIGPKLSSALLPVFPCLHHSRRSIPLTANVEKSTVEEMQSRPFKPAGGNLIGCGHKGVMLGTRANMWPALLYTCSESQAEARVEPVDAPL